MNGEVENSKNKIIIAVEPVIYDSLHVYIRIQLYVEAYATAKRLHSIFKITRRDKGQAHHN